MHTFLISTLAAIFAAMISDSVAYPAKDPGRNTLIPFGNVKYLGEYPPESFLFSVADRSPALRLLSSYPNMEDGASHVALLRQRREASPAIGHHGFGHHHHYSYPSYGFGYGGYGGYGGYSHHHHHGR